MTRAQLKYAAKDVMRRAVPSVILTTLLYLLMTQVVSYVVELFMEDPMALYLSFLDYGYPAEWAISQALAQVNLPVYFFLTLLVSLYATVVRYGYAFCMMRAARGQEYTYGGLISQFYLAWKIILLTVLEFIFVYLWALLFFIPGIIAAYRYRQSIYLLLDHPEWAPLQCIRESKRMMFGHKMELFVLDLSFLGWMFLVLFAGGLLGTGIGYVFYGASMWIGELLALAVGIALALWLTPYMELTYIHYHDQLSAQPQHMGEEPPRYDDDPWA